MTHGVLAPQRSTFTSRVTVNGSRGVAWERPADWLPVPVPSASDQRFVGLAAVFNNGANFITVRSGVAFKVDWGDGAGWVNYAANTTAEKNLAWSDYSSGTLTSRGYRQALVTVEAQSGNLTSLDLQQRHSSVPRAVATAWLDVAVSLPSGTLTFGGLNVYQSNVERVTIVGVANTSFAAMFQYCYSLQSVPLFNTTNGTNFNGMFQNCYSLQSVPALNTANGTNFSSMFQYCYSLQSVPALNTANGTNFTSMFQNCYSLQSVPALNTANGTNFTSMFYYCSSLQSVPALNTSNGTNFGNMFYYCFSLQSVPALNTSNGTNFSGMFTNCYSLQSVPALNTANGTNFSSMFYGCFSLQSAPALNTANGTNFSSMFYGCFSLQSAPALNTANGTNFSSMFYGCFSLQSAPALNTANGTNFTSMFNGCTSLQSAALNGTRYSIDYSNAMLSPAELDAIYTALGTAAGAQTITVTGNWGTATDNPSIATAKGWTVAGS